MKKTLEEYRNEIKRERKFVDVKPYSHNIISITLKIISEGFGVKEANKAIDDFNLEDLGWEKRGEKQ